MTSSEQVLAELATEAELTFSGDLPLYELPVVVAAELERHAEEIRAEAQFPANGWDAREIFRAAELYVRLRHRAQRLRMAAETLTHQRKSLPLPITDQVLPVSSTRPDLARRT